MKAFERLGIGIFSLSLLAFSFQTASAEPITVCLLYTSPSPRDLSTSRMPSSA